METTKVEKDPQLEFEKYKYKMDLVKWFIGSVTLVIVVKVIDASFQNREVNIKEFNQYDKCMSYITDNKKLGERKALAEFYKTVSLSEPVRERWNAYFVLVEKQYNGYKQQQQTTSDSITLLTQKSSLSDREEKKLSQLSTMNQFLSEQLLLPDSANNFTIARYYEKKGFDNISGGNLVQAHIDFQKSENACPTLHNVAEIKNLIGSNIPQYKNATGDKKNKIIINLGDKILKDYSWGMKEENIAKLQESVSHLKKEGPVL